MGSKNAVNATDSQALDNLIGVALLDEDIRQRLLYERTDELLTSFALSMQTRSWLRSVRATTLVDLAQAILHHQNGTSPS